MRRQLHRWWPALAAAGLFGVDQLGKWIAVRYVPVDGWFIWRPVVGMVYEVNRDLALNVPASQPAIISVTLVMIGALGWLGWRAYRRGLISVVGGLLWVVVGALSNLLDRIQYGYVIDYLTISARPVFNVADVLIAVGVVVIVRYFFRRQPPAQSPSNGYNHATQ